MSNQIPDRVREKINEFLGEPPATIDYACVDESHATLISQESFEALSESETAQVESWLQGLRGWHVSVDGNQIEASIVVGTYEGDDALDFLTKLEMTPVVKAVVKYFDAPVVTHEKVVVLVKDQYRLVMADRIHVIAG